MIIAAMSSRLRSARWLSSSVPSWARMRPQAASTAGLCGTGVQAGSRMRRRISVCATLRSNTVKASNTSRAVCDCSEVENTVRQMMSAVRWLIARSSEKASPRSARPPQWASQLSTAAVIGSKARFTRSCENAGSIMRRWRRQVSPLLTNIESPTSGASA